MNYPTIHSGWMFWGMHILLIPDAVLALRHGAGSDRLRRYRYADISQITVRTVMPGWTLAVGVFFILQGCFYIFIVETMAVGLMVGLAGLGLVFLAVVRKATTFEIHAGDAKVTFTKFGLSTKKRESFLTALLGHVERVQGVAPVKNGESEPSPTLS